MITVDEQHIQTLLRSSIDAAAKVVSERLKSDTSVVEAEFTNTTSFLRFDIGFGGGALLTWHVSNEDATGYADLLIGGEGDRLAVLSELHLDALSSAFSEMLDSATEKMNGELTSPIPASGVDMGMESDLPEPKTGEIVTPFSLKVEGFGLVHIQQTLNEQMVHMVSSKLPEYKVEAPALDSSSEEPSVVSEPELYLSEPSPNQADVVPIDSVKNTSSERSEADLQMLMNVPLPLTVELGQTQKTIKELVEMSVGSIIELAKLAGEPLEIKVNDRVIAKGEVVVIDEEFGVRVTEIVTAEERLRRIG